MRRITLPVLAIVLTAAALHSAQCAPKHVTKLTSTATRTSKQPALVRVDAPKFELPPGATLKNEINLDQQNLLAALKAALPAFTKGLGDNAGEVGDFVKALDLNGLSSCIQGLNAVRIVNFSIGSSAAAANALSFFEQQVPESKGWKRVLYSTDMMPGVVAIYSLNGKEYLGVALDGENGDDVYVGTAGFIDIAKLAGWAGHLVKTMKGMGGDVEINVQPPAKPQPAPAPAPGK